MSVTSKFLARKVKKVSKYIYKAVIIIIIIIIMKIL